jgi:hypothetical protein
LFNCFQADPVKLVGEWLVDVGGKTVICFDNCERKEYIYGSGGGGGVNDIHDDYYGYRYYLYDHTNNCFIPKFNVVH